MENAPVYLTLHFIISLPTGVVGGGSYDHDGSGANYLCLHKEPQWMNYQDGYQYSKGRAILYGAEYQTPDTIYPGKGLLNNDVPCAVCQTQHRPSVLMIPGRVQCPNSSWVMEYKGYLMAQHYTYKSNIPNCFCVSVCFSSVTICHASHSSV